MKILAILLAVCAWAQAQNGLLHHYRDVAISGDGARVAWGDDGPHGPELFVLDWKAGGQPRAIGPGSHAAWSPDGRQLAFLSTRESGQAQLWVAPATGGAARRLTALTGYLADPAWSPDGREIALLFAENAPGGGGPLEAVPAQTGVIESQVYNQRIAVVDAASGSVRQVTPKELHVYEYDWSPDGRAFAFTAAPGPGDNNWWIARLYTMALDGAAPRALFEPPARMQLAVPRWSPDGKAIAFIGGLMSDEGFTGGDIYTIAAAGGAPQNRTPGSKASPSWMAWLSPGKLLFTESVGGAGAISTLDLASRARGDALEGRSGRPRRRQLSRISPWRATVLPRPSSGRVGPKRRKCGRALWARGGRLTTGNAALKPAWGEARSIAWKNEGFDVQGWLLYPQAYDPARRYPMVVSVHGGPAGVKKAAWPSRFFEMAELSGHGYFVFFPNPRGSYGQGEAFVQANVKDFGGGDLRDILAGVDEIVKTLPVDPQRVGITGWSYGGYMSMCAVTQTDRFRAAVAGAGIANWQSYYGENSIDRWMIPYFGASVYDDPAVYAKSSPITFIKRVKTPSLVLVGERDGECPAPQSYEFWHALRTLGVDTQLVVYAGEGHMFQDPEHQHDATRRALAWFDRYLK